MAELSRFGKYAQAIPSAQGRLESLERKYGPFNVDVAGALNNLALLYGDKGRDPRGRAALQARGGDPRASAWSRSSRRRNIPQQPGLPLSEQGTQRSCPADREENDRKRRAQLRVALPVLFAAQQGQSMPAEKALDDALNVLQHGAQSPAASAVNKLAVRKPRPGSPSRPSTVSRPIRKSAVPRRCGRRCCSILTTPRRRKTAIPPSGLRWH